MPNFIFNSGNHPCAVFSKERRPDITSPGQENYYTFISLREITRKTEGMEYYFQTLRIERLQYDPSVVDPIVIKLYYWLLPKSSLNEPIKTNCEQPSESQIRTMASQIEKAMWHFSIRMETKFTVVLLFDPDGKSDVTHGFSVSSISGLATWPLESEVVRPKYSLPLERFNVTGPFASKLSLPALPGAPTVQVDKLDLFEWERQLDFQIARNQTKKSDLDFHIDRIVFRVYELIMRMFDVEADVYLFLVHPKTMTTLERKSADFRRKLQFLLYSLEQRYSVSFFTYAVCYDEDGLVDQIKEYLRRQPIA